MDAAQWNIMFAQRTLTYFERGSITVPLTSCLTGLDSTKLVNLYLIQHKQSSWILNIQTGGQSYSDTSPYKVSVLCLALKLPEVPILLLIKNITWAERLGTRCTPSRRWSACRRHLWRRFPASGRCKRSQSPPWCPDTLPAEQKRADMIKIWHFIPKFISYLDNLLTRV